MSLNLGFRQWKLANLSGGSRPLDKGRGAVGVSRKFFSALRVSVSSRNKGGAGPLPWQSATESSKQIRTDPFWAQVNSTVADLGESPSLVLDQTEARRAEKKFFGDRLPPLSQVTVDRHAPPLSEGLDPPLL